MVFVVWGEKIVRFIDLSHLAARLHPTQEGGDGEASIEVEGREDHATTLDAHHLRGARLAMKSTSLPISSSGL